MIREPKLKENGVIITYPKKDKFAERVQPLLNAYQDQPKLYQLIQRIQATED